ncbi:serine hydrolase [Chroococcidiopsis sp. CCALA 051]|uniref:serine hydrolase domain-containing protein n=1 Tax=Chroococcidiopsis sp. CCALA 051 TaxID=869949 RepID=UPI000D0D8683|nr:serine hydrolase domain-containing protein [Chroococcidiopsis sp. CCALA 051]PSM47686.1 serine hydrolase [Chroococcidiopsis sp. CCALA 051]
MIDDYIEALRINHSIPGLSITVVKDGIPLLVKGYGLANVELSVPATETSVYELASIGKTFTATATMMLVEQNKISLDDSIADYLDNPPLAWQPVTLKHILCHQSGIPSYTSVAEYWQKTRLDISRQEILALVSELPLIFSPGEYWSYDNTGYYLLGFMLEKVSGKPYEVLLKELIFTPLEMTATVMNDPAKIIKDRVAGYCLENNTLQNKEYYSPSNTYSAGGWVSSVTDMVKWEAALCSEKILKRSTLQQMWRSHESKLGNEREKYGFTNGLGWHIPNYSDKLVVGHNGSIKGFATNITRYIDDKVTVILLCNLENIERPDAIAKSIAEQFIPHLAEIPLQPPL